MTIIVFLSGAAVVAAVPAILAKRHLQRHADGVRAAWEKVQSALEKRHELALQMVAHSAQPDDVRLNSLQTVLKQAEFTSGLSMKLRVENQLGLALHEMVAIGGDAQFAKFDAALSEVAAAIRAAAENYNGRVSDYNAEVRRLARVARFFGYESREPFVLEI